MLEFLQVFTGLATLFVAFVIFMWAQVTLDVDQTWQTALKGLAAVLGATISLFLIKWGLN